jgi:hypothetical protein
MTEVSLPAAAIGLVLFGAIVLRPLLGACLVLFATPLIVGIARGEFGGELRPNELLLGLVLAAMAVRTLLLMLGRRWQPPIFDAMDVALLALVATGSAMPVLWRIARGLPLTTDDLLYAVVLVKYYAVFRLFRGAVTTEAAVATCLRVALLSSAIVAVIALLESFRLFGVAEFLAAHYDSPFSGSEGPVTGRAASTVASVFGLADLMIISLVLALSLRRIALRGRGPLAFCALLCTAGCIVTGTFSGYIGLAVALLAFGAFTRSLHRTVPLGAAVGGVAAAAFWPLLEQRLAGFAHPAGMPPSWKGRMQNLQDHFLPQIGQGANWLLGVRPAPRLPATERWREWIFIESGYVWLVWIGGLPFLIAFIAFVAVALSRLGAVARRQADAIGAAALTARCAVVLVAVLMLLDPHLTIRGGADILFPLLALGLVPAAAPLTAAPRAAVPDRPRVRILFPPAPAGRPACS